MGCVIDDEVVVVPVTVPEKECPDNIETFGQLLSAFTNEQVPEFVRQNHPKFVEYLNAYNEFLELPANPVGRITCFPDLTNVDFTTDEFFYLFKQTFLAPFPETFMADRALVTKKIKDFYAAKGTIASKRVLFRILFGEEITIFLPKLFLLKASDGKWQQNTTIFVTQETGDPFEFAQLSVTGQTTGATAEIDFVEVETIGPFTVYSLILLNYTGTFEDGEQIVADQCPEQFTATILGFVQDVTITNGGDDYIVGDVVDIDHVSGIGATAEVSKVSSTTPVIGFTINDGGDGFRVGDPIDFTPNAAGGFDAVAQVSAITITTSISQSDKTIAEEQNTELTTVAAIVIEDFLNFHIIDRGVITGITLAQGGHFYPSSPFPVEVGGQPPAPCTGWDFGVGADIDAITDNTGNVLEVEVLTAGIGYTDSATADFNSGNGLATGTPVVNGGPLVNGGFYRNSDGFLSWDKRLQDNVFWQNYSYEITSEHSINEWRDVVKSTTHPAGYALWGNLCLINEAVNTFRVNAMDIDKCIVIEIDLSGGVIDHLDDVDVLYWGSFIPCQDYDPFTPIIAEYQAELLEDWADVPIVDLVLVDSDPCYQQNIAIYEIDHP